MSRRCAYDRSCDRAPIPDAPDGTVHANCDGHEALLVGPRFARVAPEPRPVHEPWHAAAAAGRLRPAVTGGIPVTTSSGPVPGVEALSPQGPGHPQSAGAPVTTSHDSPLSVTPDPFPRRAPRGAERDAAATPAGA